MPPINPKVTKRYGRPVACDEMAKAADAINDPAIVIDRNPHRFAMALTNGPAIK